MKIRRTIWNNCEVMNMSNLVVLPIIIPLLAGIIIAFFNKNLPIARTLSKIFSFICLFVTAYVTYLVFTHGIIVLETGSWAAPYGIIFVADPLSISLDFTTNIFTTTCYFLYH